MSNPDITKMEACRYLCELKDECVQILVHVKTRMADDPEYDKKLRLVERKIRALELAGEALTGDR